MDDDVETVLEKWAQFSRKINLPLKYFQVTLKTIFPQIFGGNLIIYRRTFSFDNDRKPFFKKLINLFHLNDCPFGKL